LTTEVAFHFVRGREGVISLRHRVQTGSGVHPASYPLDRGKVAGV